MTAISIAEYRRLKTRGTKYRNTLIVVAGEKYRSRKEYVFHTQCQVQTKAADPAQRIVKIEREVYYRLVPAQRDAKGRLVERAMGYFLDFRLTFADGRVEHVDVKSPATRKIASYIQKRKLLLLVHGIRIHEL